MNKKFISIVMAMILAVSTAAVSASAEEVEVEASGNTTGTIFFDSGEWNSDKLYFYIWDATDGTKANKTGWVEGDTWGSKKLAGTEVEGQDGVFESYEIEFKEGHDLFVIFYDPDKGAQTYDCTLDASAIGDTAYMTGVTLENPVDSEKTCIEAVFSNADCGPYRQITSTGKIVGNYSVPSDDPAYTVAKFIIRYGGEKEKITGEDIVTADSVSNAIDTFGTTADDVWASIPSVQNDANVGSYYSDDKVAIAKEVLGIKDATSDTDAATDTDTASDDDEDDTTSNTSSKSSTTNNTTSKSSTTTTKTTTTTSTGAVDSAATGDATGTAAFAAVLLAAAGAIVVTRKKVQE